MIVLDDEILYVLTSNKRAGMENMVEFEMFIRDTRLQFDGQVSTMFEFFREGEDKNQWIKSAKKRAEKFPSPTKDFLKELSDVDSLYTLFVNQLSSQCFQVFVDSDKKETISLEIVVILKKHFFKNREIETRYLDWDNPYPRK